MPHHPGALQDPVVAAEGHTYDHAAIKGGCLRCQRVAAGRAPCSPLTNLPLPHTGLQANHALRKLAAGFVSAGLLR